jgi:hypothetical protein
VRTAERVAENYYTSGVTRPMDTAGLQFPLNGAEAQKRKMSNPSADYILLAVGATVDVSVAVEV